jgi:hypothetical protein
LEPFERTSTSSLRTAAARASASSPADLQHVDRHRVAGQGARLVRADDGHPAQRLRRRDAADDHAALAHPLHRPHEGGGGHHGQALRDRRHREGHRAARRREPGDPAQHAHPAGGETAPDAQHRQVPAEVVESLLERRRRGRLALEQEADPRGLGGGAGGRDEGPTVAPGDDRAGVEHRAPLGERRPGSAGLPRLGGGLALAGQDRLVAGQPVRVMDARVGGDGVAGPDQNEVAGNEPCRGHRPERAAADHPRLPGLEAAPGSDEVLGLALDAIADPGVEADRGQDPEGVQDVADEHGEPGGAEEQRRGEIDDLGEEQLERRARANLGDEVRTDLGERPLRLVVRQPPRARPKPTGNLGHWQEGGAREGDGPARAARPPPSGVAGALADLVLHLPDAPRERRPRRVRDQDPPARRVRPHADDPAALAQLGLEVPGEPLVPSQGGHVEAQTSGGP